MDTYSIYKASKGVFRKLLREANPDKDDYWCDCEADYLANDVVEECIRCGLQYPFSEINKPRSQPSFPIDPTFK